MQKGFISPLNDDVVKSILGDQRNIKNTEEFLKAVLQPEVANIPPEEYDKLTIRDPFLKRRWKRDKQGILDIRLTTKTGRIVNVEIQVNRKKFMVHRIIYYLAKLVTEQMKSGFDYDMIHQTICIVITNHILLPDETDYSPKRYMNTFELRNTKTGKPFTDLLKVVTLELPRVPETDDGHPVWPWLAFFKCKSEEELKMLLIKHPKVKPAVEEYQKMTWSDRRRMIAEYKEKWRRDRWAELEYAKDEGLELGMEKSREVIEEKDREIAELRRKLQDLGGL
jgi:predicted transposase/invertase (TIGR01784 family)